MAPANSVFHEKINGQSQNLGRCRESSQAQQEFFQMIMKGKSHCKTDSKFSNKLRKIPEQDIHPHKTPNFNGVLNLKESNFSSRYRI